jgi:hypothetical protein
MPDSFFFRLSELFTWVSTVDAVALMFPLDFRCLASLSGYHDVIPSTSFWH